MLKVAFLNISFNVHELPKRKRSKEMTVIKEVEKEKSPLIMNANKTFLHSPKIYFKDMEQ